METLPPFRFPPAGILMRANEAPGFIRYWQDKMGMTDDDFLLENIEAVVVKIKGLERKQPC